MSFSIYVEMHEKATAAALAELSTKLPKDTQKLISELRAIRKTQADLRATDSKLLAKAGGGADLETIGTDRMAIHLKLQGLDARAATLSKAIKDGILAAGQGLVEQAEADWKKARDDWHNARDSWSEQLKEVMSRKGAAEMLRNPQLQPIAVLKKKKEMGLAQTQFGVWQSAFAALDPANATAVFADGSKRYGNEDPYAAIVPELRG